MRSLRGRLLVLLASVFVACLAFVQSPVSQTNAHSLPISSAEPALIGPFFSNEVNYATGYSQTISWRFMFDRINDYRRKVPPYENRYGDPVPPLTLDTSLHFSSVDKAINYPYRGEYNNDPKIHLDQFGYTVSERLYKLFWIPKCTAVSEVVFYTSRIEWDGFMGAMKFWGYDSSVHMQVLRDPRWKGLGVAAAYTQTPVNNTARTYPSVYIAEFAAAYKTC